jgi:ribulose-5-phosphate 4-epimerase/fuculose-1-phosphate aldolase
MAKPLEVPSVRQRVSEGEWQARVELAAAYRLVAHYGWTHLINNHISLRVPGTKDQFLINPYGFLYEQITASSLVKIDVDGNVLDDSPYEVNRAGFVIHSAIHMARKDLHAIIHTHTVAGQAVCALACGLLPLNQSAMRYSAHSSGRKRIACRP